MSVTLRRIGWLLCGDVACKELDQYVCTSVSILNNFVLAWCVGHTFRQKAGSVGASDFCFGRGQNTATTQGEGWGEGEDEG